MDELVYNVKCTFSPTLEKVGGSCLGAILNESDSQLTTNAGTTVPVGADFEQVFLEELQEPPRMTPQVLVRVGVLAVIGGVSLVANLMALTSIFRMRQRRMSSHSSTLYTLLAHMSVADLLVTLFCIVAEALWTYTIAWLADDLTCKFVKYAQVFALYLSTFILIVLALDQLLIVRYPLRRDANIVLIRRTVFAAWILAALLSLPQILIFRVARGPFVEEFYQCVTYGFYTAPWQEQLYALVSLLLMFIFPLATLVVTYAATFRTIANLPAIHCEDAAATAHQQDRKQKRNFLNPISTFPRLRENGVRSSHPICGHPMEVARRRLLAKAKKKSLTITVVIVVAFIVCWTPYYAMMVIFIFNLDPDQRITGELQSAIFFFGSSTAMINPVIYGAFHLRRPREARSQHSTVVLSSASFRQPAAFEAKQTIAQVNNVHPDGQFCVKHCIATPSSREKTRRRDRSCSPVQIEIRIDSS